MFIALLFLLQLPAPAPLQPQDAASIEGIVIDGQTNRPLANVAISGRNSLTAEALSLNTGLPLSEVLITGLLLQGAALLSRTLLYKTAVANEDGRFTMTGIAPGPYKIFAWESIPATAWLTADYISKYEELGRSLTVPGSLEAPLNLIPRDR